MRVKQKTSSSFVFKIFMEKNHTENFVYLIFVLDYWQYKTY